MQRANGLLTPQASNARNVWQIPTQGRPEAHFATFPDELPRRCILAGASEHGVCAECGGPWARTVEKEWQNTRPNHYYTTKDANADSNNAGSNRRRDGDRSGYYETQTVGWQPTCDHNAARVPAVVLDPFIGSGTTIAVAQQLGRHGIGRLDLNPDYLAIAAKRLAGITLPQWASGYDPAPPLAAAPEGSTQAQAAGDAPGGDAGFARRLRFADALHDGGM